MKLPLFLILIGASLVGLFLSSSQVPGRTLSSLPKYEVFIDISDSKTNKNHVVITIYNRGCKDGFKAKKSILKDKEKLNKAVDSILNLRRITGYCK